LEPPSDRIGTRLQFFDFFRDGGNFARRFVHESPKLELDVAICAGEIRVDREPVFTGDDFCLLLRRALGKRTIRHMLDLRPALKSWGDCGSVAERSTDRRKSACTSAPPPPTLASQNNGSAVKNATIVDVEQPLSTLRKGGWTRRGGPSHTQSYFVGFGSLPDEVRVSTGGDTGVSQGKVPSSRN
jgi:hypothetical protein